MEYCTSMVSLEEGLFEVVYMTLYANVYIYRFVLECFVIKE